VLLNYLIVYTFSAIYFTLAILTTQKLKITADEHERRRLEAGQLLLTTTLSKAEIARRLGVSRSAVTQWAQQMKKRQGRLDALRSRPHTGRPPRLGKANWRLVLALLRRGAVEAGFTTERWTLARVQQLIQREFGISYSKSYLSDKLYSLGWSLRRPASRDTEPEFRQLPWHYNYSSFWSRRWR
jgi:transposase